MRRFTFRTPKNNQDYGYKIEENDMYGTQIKCKKKSSIKNPELKKLIRKLDLILNWAVKKWGM
jgi:hypothetical protein